MARQGSPAIADKPVQCFHNTGVHGPKFPGPACSHYSPARPGPLIKVICKALPVQAHSLAGPARPVPASSLRWLQCITPI